MAEPMSPPSRDVSVPGLIKSLADDVTHLFAQEVALAKTEVSSAVKDIKAGVLSLAIGLGVLFAGFIVLLGAAVAGLALVMETWLAALIVGGVVAIIGVVLLMKAKSALNPDSMVPNRTIESLKKDEAMVRRTVS
jgi:predicted phage tail protein